MVKIWKSTDVNGKPQLEEVAADSFAISSPTVVYINGWTLFRFKERSILANALQRMKEFLPPEMGVSHYAGSSVNLSNIFSILSYHFNPQDSYSDAARMFTERLIMPLVSEEGRPLPEMEARKRLRNLTLVSQSAGSLITQQMFNAALAMMQDIGYEKETARHLLQDIVLISTGNMTRPQEEDGRFTTLYLAAKNDLDVHLVNALFHPLETLSKIFNERSLSSLAIHALSKTSLLVTAAIPTRKWEWRKNLDGALEKKRITPSLPYWTRIYTHHEWPHYITTDDAHNAFSKIVMNAMFNAVRRKGRLNPLHLLEPAPHLTPAETAAYCSRILKAAMPGQAL